MALNRVDLPTFGRPINATTGSIAWNLYGGGGAGGGGVADGTAAGGGLPRGGARSTALCRRRWVDGAVVDGAAAQSRQPQAPLTARPWRARRQIWEWLGTRPGCRRRSKRRWCRSRRRADWKRAAWRRARARPIRRCSCPANVRSLENQPRRLPCSVTTGVLKPRRLSFSLRQISAPSRCRSATTVPSDWVTYKLSPSTAKPR